MAKKILVVDDELGIREFLQMALGDEGFEVITVPSAAQGLEAVIREPFDLVITDVLMRDGSGIWVVQKIREHNRQVPVVIYSGAVTTELEKQARAAGANEVLSKTTGLPALVSQIKKLLEAAGRLQSGTFTQKDRPILIVDDEESIRKLLRTFFNGKGYRTLEAENGQKALELVSSQKIAVVLLDMNMPGMDGLETLEKLLKIDPKLGVVMATGMHSDESVRKALELGAYGYVLKPFDFLYLDLVVLSKLKIAS